MAVISGQAPCRQLYSAAILHRPRAAELIYLDDWRASERRPSIVAALLPYLVAEPTSEVSTDGPTVGRSVDKPRDSAAKSHAMHSLSCFVRQWRNCGPRRPAQAMNCALIGIFFLGGGLRVPEVKRCAMKYLMYRVSDQTSKSLTRGYF